MKAYEPGHTDDGFGALTFGEEAPSLLSEPRDHHRAGDIHPDDYDSSTFLNPESVEDLAAALGIKPLEPGEQIRLRIEVDE